MLSRHNISASSLEAPAVSAQPGRTPPDPGMTALQRQLAGDRPPPRPTPLDAFEAARRTFLAGGRLDMQELAAELGVNRVTLYRWVGSREQLLTEVLWALTTRSFDGYIERAQLDEPRVAALLSMFIRDVLANPGMRRLLDDEGDFAMRVLTGRDSAYRQRLMRLVHDLLAEDRAAGRLTSTVPLEDLAYTAVRITESYVHTRVITGEDPDADRASRVLYTLLR